jgi:glucose/arabinose dehydrogenase
MKFTFALGLALALVGAADAQRRVPFAGDEPVPPPGVPVPPLPERPIVLDTAEGQRIRVVVLVRGLANPWSLAFLPDGRMLIAERVGRLRVIQNGVLDPQPITGLPRINAVGRNGLMDLALHPRFAENHFVYFTYSKDPGQGLQRRVTLARGRLEGRSVVDVTDVFLASIGTCCGSRIAFAKDGTIFMTTGGANPQDANTHGGKVLRLRDDGSAPPDNPLVGKPGHRPEVYSLGHRQSIGLAIHPETGEPWINENGDNGGDELNRILPGRNYGFPLVSYGRKYSGPRVSEQPWREGMEQPVTFWMPSVAPSGLTFYTGDRLAKWKGDAFVGSLQTGEIPNTGHLERILFNEKMEELRRESLLVEMRQRIRDVRQGPDELLYLLTDHATDGALLRIEPVD